MNYVWIFYLNFFNKTIIWFIRFYFALCFQVSFDFILTKVCFLWFPSPNGATQTILALYNTTNFRLGQASGFCDTSVAAKVSATMVYSKLYIECFGKN